MIENENTIRLTAFLAIFILCALLEIVLPRRQASFSKSFRWWHNFSIFVVDVLFLKILVPFTLVNFASGLQEKKIGLLNIIELNQWLEFLFAIVLFDFIIYIQHWYFHKNKFLWHFHKVHHSDLDLDVSSAIRFHPIEILFSLIIKIAVVYLLGIPPLAILVFEILLNGGAIFTHANLAISLKWDKYIRYFLITPEMHRIHHSIEINEMNSNYGFHISIWDRLFKTYTAQSVHNQNTMPMGLNVFKTKQSQNLKSLLLMPFRKNKILE